MEEIITKDVPGMPGVTVNNRGRVEYKGKPLLRSENSWWGYPCVVVPGEGEQLIHRLVCLTFNGPPPDDERILVNHKDGNKFNSRPENLEWVSYSENLDHAYRTGLRTDNTPIVVKNLGTGVEQEFHSLQSAAIYFEVNGGRIHEYLASASKFPFKDIYDMRYKTGKFKGLTKKDMFKVTGGVPRQIVAIHKDGTIELFDGAAVAAAKYGLSAIMVLRATQRKIPHWVKDKWMFRLLHEYAGEIPPDTKVQTRERQKGKPPKRVPVPVKMVDLITGEVLRFPCSVAAGKAFGVKKSAIQKATKYTRWRGYNVSYEEPSKIKV